MRCFAFICLVLGLSMPAFAQKSVSIRGAIGISAEAEGGDVKVDGENQGEMGTADLESNLGAIFTADFPSGDAMRIGIRAALMKADIEDSDDASVLTVDGGGYLRFILGKGDMKPFISGAAGLTWASLNYGDEAEVEPSGIGFHIAAGGGFEMPVSPTMNFIAALEYSYQSVTLEDEIEGYDLEMEATVTRLIISGGLAF